VLGHYPDLSISEAREKLSDQSTFEEVFEEWFEMKKDDWTHEYA